MKHLVIDRRETGDEGVFGTAELQVDGKPIFHFFTGEEEWRDNQPQVSCIPVGAYSIRFVDSPKFGKVYEVCDVPGRKHILIHGLNTEEDTEGCIGLGLTLGYVVVKKDEDTGKENVRKRAILQSRAAIEKFLKLMNGEDGLVTIRWYGE